MNFRDDGYVPPAHGGTWERLAPETAGFDARKLAEATHLAETRVTDWPVDLRAHIEAGYFEPPPNNEILGPLEPRGGPNGVILRGGRIVATWGDTRRADATFSVAKSYLSLLAGVAVADGLIADLDEPVGQTVKDGGFEGPHNSLITWRHLLQQTSEWEGTLFGKSDAIDRNRIVSLDGKANNKGEPRPLKAPGGYWEYNDVRVNRLSLALLRRFERPLPEVFAERIMRPIGASGSWHWEGYRNSWIDVGKTKLQSVPGGAHWGGGMFISAEDQARIGLLMLRRGVWDGRMVIDPAWVAESITPCSLNPVYGLMWWLNSGGRRYAAAPESSFFALGTGGNITWVDPEADLVAVARWLENEQTNAFIGAVLGALKG
jgi:CubicO group peptidase (beta-lactamase class C family)